MIYFTKIENNNLIIKIIENNNTHSLLIKINISNDTLHIFRDFYYNIHKNVSLKINLDDTFIEYKDNIITFDNLNFQFKVNKTPEIIDMFDKIITNLMIYDMEHDSPKKGDTPKFFSNK